MRNAVRITKLALIALTLTIANKNVVAQDGIEVLGIEVLQMTVGPQGEQIVLCQVMDPAAMAAFSVMNMGGQEGIVEAVPVCHCSGMFQVTFPFADENNRIDVVGPNGIEVLYSTATKDFWELD